MGGVVKPPTEQQIADTVAELDRLGVPVITTIADARAALQNARSGVSTTRIRLSLNRRKAEAGLTPRNADAAKLKRAPSVSHATGQKRSAELALSVFVDSRLLGARCVGRHHLFDQSQDGETNSERTARHLEAVQICQGCPVLEACREVAIENAKVVAGVWAGVLTR